MNTKENDIALVVHACDRYEFLYPGFEFFFNKYWDSSIQCNCYFATENKQVNIKGFTNIHSGMGPWADRLSLLLRHSVKEKYILYFQEDMWLNTQVNADFFNQLFQHMRQNDWPLIKLHSSAVYRTVPTPDYIEGFNIATVDNETSDFLMSHQVSLWNKSFLIDQLYKNEHPWRNERKGTKRLKKLNPVILQIDFFAENGNPAININNNPVQRSEYQTISVNGCLNSNVISFINELQASGEESRQYAERLQYNFDNQLTHDGKAKPMKVDAFKRIKNWLKAHR